MDPKLKNVIELQKVDMEIQAIRGQIDEIPKNDEGIRRELLESKTVLAEYRKRLDTQERLRHGKENEVEINKDKKSKYEAQLYKVRTNKEYTSLLSEIDEVSKQSLQLEDEILQLMEDIESLRQDLAVKESEFESETKNGERVIAENRTRKAALEAQLTELEQVRQKLIARVDPPLRTRYERIAKVRKNAVVPVTDSACTGCFMVIRPQMLSHLMAGDTIVTCENCSRILYYQPVDAANGQVDA
ncbi:MAG TPA: C4-type zinc ribbon domain-containing protein [Thermodesulfobacteriota bacterium]|nr:C4-type zinc ribbon domain-containing protein [Thermodesulfobacteriota bacterium]